MLRLLIGSGLVSLFLVRVAHAQPPGETSATPPGLTPPVASATKPSGSTRETASYRGSILAADALAVGVLVWTSYDEGEFDDGDANVGLGAAIYGLGAPLIHLVKGRNPQAMKSLALRVGLPLVLGYIGNALQDCDYDYDPTNGMCDDYDKSGWVNGAIVGAVLASAIDIAFLAGPDRPAPASVPTSAVAPTVRSTNGGVALGLAGHF